MRPNRIALLTNIPTPYRLPLFEALSGALKREGFEFKVFFMAEREAGHTWKVDFTRYSFDHEIIWSPISWQRGFPHYNPFVVKHLKKYSPSVLILGGYDSVTYWLARLSNIPAARVLWSETHALSEHSISNRSLRKLAKRFFVRGFSAFLFPTNRAFDFMRGLSGRSDLEARLFRNTIDESFYHDDETDNSKLKTELHEKFSIPQDKILAFSAARLVPEKGFLEFFKNLAACDAQISSQFIFLIAGDGTLRRELEELRVSAKVRIELLGGLDAHAVAQTLKGCDLLFLPSVRDSAPLATVEAIAAGCPMLLSSRIGTYEDVLTPGVNGFGFNPYSSSELCQALTRFAALDSSEISQFRTESRNIFKERFTLEKNVATFVNFIKDIAVSSCRL